MATGVPAAAHAAPVDIDVRGPDGRPLEGAVVMINSPRQPPLRPPSAPLVMAQQNISFQPHVLIVPVGATVAFPNRDKVRHHVYSFSKAKKFELKLYGHDESRTELFDRPGVVALGCNIHDAMSGFILVVDTPYAVLVGPGGRAHFADVPASGATLRIWHPSVRTPGNMLSQPLAVAAAPVARTVAVSGP